MKQNERSDTRAIADSARHPMLGLALALVLASLAGCSGGGKSDEGASTPPAPASAPSHPAATTSPPDTNGVNRVIAIISPAKTSPFHVALAEGAAAEAKQQGLPPIIDQAPDKESNYTGQVAVVQDVIQQHPAAISICGINPEALKTIVQKANDANIPIFIHNQITPIHGGGKVAAYIGYDERLGGLKCGTAAAEMLKQKNGDYKGTVAILDGEPGDHTDARAGGFKQALLKNHPNIKVVDEQNGKWQRADGTSITRDWLQRYPNLDLVFGCSDEMALGAAKAGKDTNHPLLTIGIDGNKNALEDVKAGNYTASLATQPAKMGATVLDTVLGYLNKKQTGQVVQTQTVIVTKQNVDQYLK